MKFFTPLTLAALIPVFLAQPIHKHQLHKRDAAYVTVTSIVYVTDDYDLMPSSTTFSSQSDYSNVLSSSTSSETLISTSISQSSSFSTTLYSNTGSQLNSTTLTASNSSSAASSTSFESSGPVNSNISFAAGTKGITYSPYTNTGSCKDANTVKLDIAKLTQFDIIRLYDTDCSCVENVLAAKQPNQKIFAGIFYLDKISDSVNIIKNAVNGSWDEIYTVSIGNELVNDGVNTPDEIKSAVATGRSALTAAGYSGLVVSVDTLVAVQNNPELCQYSDYVAVNSHPYWDGHVVANDSGSFLKTQIANIKNICGGKDVLITETGWPTQGQAYGSAVPSISNQHIAIQAIASEVGEQVLIFTAYNDLWKAPGDYGVEQYWGILQN